MIKSQRRTISANDAKQRWGSMMDAVDDGERVVVESHGKPKVAVVSYEDLQRLEDLDDRERRDDAVRRLAALKAKASNPDNELTDQEIEELSIAVGRDIKRRAAEKQRERAGTAGK